MPPAHPRLRSRSGEKELGFCRNNRLWQSDKPELTDDLFGRLIQHGFERTYTIGFVGEVTDFLATRVFGDQWSVARRAQAATFGTGRNRFHVDIPWVAYSQAKGKFGIHEVREAGLAEALVVP